MFGMFVLLQREDVFMSLPRSSGIFLQCGVVSGTPRTFGLSVHKTLLPVI